MEEVFSFGQRWFPSLADAEELDMARSGIDSLLQSVEAVGKGEKQ